VKQKKRRDISAKKVSSQQICQKRGFRIISVSTYILVRFSQNPFALPRSGHLFLSIFEILKIVLEKIPHFV